MSDHLILLHAAARNVPGYNRHEAPSILLEGSSLDQRSEHGLAVTAQLSRRHDTLAEAIESAILALGAAGLDKGIRRQARAACEDYFYTRLGHGPELPLANNSTAIALEAKGEQTAAEQLPEPIFKTLDHLVGLVVDGEYDELCELSGDVLKAEDLRRRVEDECPEALILPSRESYQTDAISPSEDEELPDVQFFLELWTEAGPARLHLVGTLEESGGRYTAILTDILP